MATTWYATTAGASFNGGTSKGAPLYTGTDGVVTGTNTVSSQSATWTSAIIGQGIGIRNASIPAGSVNLITAVAPQTSFSVTTSSGSTTVTSSGLFTSAMVGQLISGPGLGTNNYITAFTNSSSVTVANAASTGFGTGTATLYPSVTVNGQAPGTIIGAGLAVTWNVGGALGANISNAAGAISAGDTVYIGGGTYYSANLNLTISGVSSTGSSGSPINIIGDVTGANTGYAGEVVMAANSSNSANSTAAVIAIGAATSYVNYSNITICGQATLASGSTNITFTDCTFINPTSNVVSATTAAAAANYTFDRCSFLTGGSNGYAMQFTLTTNTTTEFDANIVIRNCVLISSGYNSSTGTGLIQVVAGGTSAKHGGGVKVYNCTLISPVGGVSAQTSTYLSTTYPCEVHNCIIYSAGPSLFAGTSGQLTESYNMISGGRTNVTAGTGSVTAFNNVIELGQTLRNTGIAKSWFSPNPTSKALGFGSGGTGGNYPTVDLLNRPRPSGGGSANYAAGALELHDFAIQDTTVYPTGYTSSAKLVGPGDQYLLIPVDPIAHQFSVQVYQGSGYTGTFYATATILANGELGIGAQTVTASSTLSAWQTLTFSNITPSKAGFITLQVTSYDTSGTGTLNFGAIN